MIPFLTLLAAASTAATVIGTVGSVRAQSRAASLQRRQEELSNTRNRRQAIREYQIQRARAMAGAVGAGAGFGSGVAGGIGGLSSQIGSDLGFGSQMSGLSAGINRANTQANNMSGLAQLGGVGLNSAVTFGFNPLQPLGNQSMASTPSGNTVSAYTPYTGQRPQARPAAPFTSVNNMGPGFR